MRVIVDMPAQSLGPCRMVDLSQSNVNPAHSIIGNFRGLRAYKRNAGVTTGAQAMNKPTSSNPVSRRQVLCAGLAAGASLACARTSWAAEPPSPISRAIPGTSERLPVVGLGTDKFRTDARDAIRAEINRMVELGGTVIDTAAAYGDSEAIIGDVVASLGVRDRLFLATKLTGSGSFRGGATGEASFNRSLERMRTTRIDLLQVHNLDGVDELMPMLQRWKQSGRIRYLGITTSRVGQHAQMAAYMRKYPLDFIQVDYSLANRDAANAILPLAVERNTAVLVNVPFAYGSLLGQLRSRALPAWANEIDVGSWAQFLLMYVVSHPAVTCTIPGSTQVAHLEDNQGAAKGRLPDQNMRHKMEQFWDAT
jgi:aryl-alcohol dehydrogenase-like predicted oxidoreductase